MNDDEERCPECGSPMIYVPMAGCVCTVCEYDETTEY